MQVQYQKGIPPTIPKNPVDDHNTCTVTKKIHKDYHFLLCLLLLQRNQHLSSATVGFLSLSSVTANLQTLRKTFPL